MPRVIELRKFKPKEYEAYCEQPSWAWDDPDFTEDDYHTYWVQFVEALAATSANDALQKRWKSIGRRMQAKVEESRYPQEASSSLENNVGLTTSPMLRAKILEKVAIMASNAPHPIYVSPVDQANAYVAALNQFKDIELKCNNFKMKWRKAMYYCAFYRCAFFKISLDGDKKGPYGQDTSLCIETIDPQNIHLDPKAKDLDWDSMTYIIQDHMMEIGELRKKYKDMGVLVPSTLTSQEDMNDVTNSDFGEGLKTVVPKVASGLNSLRRLIKVREIWFKDSRLKFEAYPSAATYDDAYDEYAYQVDDKGFVKGEWVPAFPHGRCIVTCPDAQAVLLDIENPFAHREAPYVFMPVQPAEGLVGPGEAFFLGRDIDKYQDIEQRYLRALQSEIERPILADINTFPDPHEWYNADNSSSVILQINGDKPPRRMEVVEPPQTGMAYLQMLSTQMDATQGLSNIQRGMLSDGAQMSAEAMQSLQTYSSAPVKFQSEYAQDAVRRLGRQIMWCIRQTYDQKITVQLQQPDGTPLIIDWEKDKATILHDGEDAEIIEAAEDYLVEIQPGSGEPGAKQLQLSEANYLYENKAIDRQAILDAHDYGGRSEINQRMTQSEQQALFNQAAGKAYGVSMKKAEKADESAGRKSKV